LVNNVQQQQQQQQQVAFVRNRKLINNIDGGLISFFCSLSLDRLFYLFCFVFLYVHIFSQR